MSNGDVLDLDVMDIDLTNIDGMDEAVEGLDLPSVPEGFYLAQVLDAGSHVGEDKGKGKSLGFKPKMLVNVASHASIFSELPDYWDTEGSMVQMTPYVFMGYLREGKFHHPVNKDTKLETPSFGITQWSKALGTRGIDPKNQINKIIIVKVEHKAHYSEEDRQVAEITRAYPFMDEDGERLTMETVAKVSDDL